MADEVINLKIRIGADGVQNIDVVDAKIGQLDQSAKEASQSLRGMGESLQGMLLAAGAIASVGGAATAYIAFMDAVANTASVAGATREELKRLEQAAREQAAVSVYSAKQAADAQYYLASAGMNVSQVISAQAGVMDLAAATQATLAQTSATVAATLSQFGLAADQSGRVADVFAAAIAGSQATMDKLGASMRYVGPVANSLGLSLEQTTALLMALYNAGFEASQAGTILRSAMSTLLDPTKEQAAALAALGVSATDSTGQLKPFAQVVEDLRRAGADASAVIKIFGQEAGPGMLALVGQGKAAIDGLESKLYSSGKAAEMAKAQVDTLGGDLKMLGSASEEAAIAFFEVLDPALRRTVQGMTWLVSHSEILSRALGTAGAAVAVFKAESLLAETSLSKLSGGLQKTWALVAAHPVTAAVVAAGALATAVAVWSAANENAAEKQARLTKATEDATQAYKESASKLDSARSALGTFETQIAAAAGEHRAEWEAVQRLNAVFPDLVRSYNNAEISLARLVQMVRAHVAVLQEEAEAKRRAAVDAKRAELDRLAEAYEQAQARMADAARKYQEQIAAYLSGAPIDVRGISEESQGAVLAIGAVEAAAKSALDTIRELAKIGPNFPELADHVDGMKARVVRDLEEMASQITGLSGAPANALAHIKMLLEGVSEAAKKAGDAASYTGDRALQAFQAGTAEALKLAETINKKQQETTAAKLELLQRELAFAAAGSNEQVQLQMAAAALEKEINEKRAKEAEQAAKKRLAAEKKVADEIIKAYKEVQDERAKNEKIALDAAEKWDQDQLKLKQWYAAQKAKIDDGETGYKIAKLEEEWEAYYAKNERTLETERIRAASIAAIQDEYAKQNRSALDKVIADFADADKNIGELTTHTLKNIQSMFASDLVGGIKKIFGDVESEYGYLGARLIDITAQVVSQILVIWASANIARLFSGGGYLPLFGGVLGGGAAAGASGSATSGLGLASAAKGLWDLGGLFSGASTGGVGGWLVKTFGASGDVLGVGMGGAGESTLWGMSAGQINAMLGAAGVGALGGQFVTPLIYGNKGYSTLGGTIGAAAGAGLGMSSTAMAALGLSGGPWTAAALGLAGLLAGGGLGSLFGGGETNDAPKHYATNLQKLLQGGADALTLNDLYRQQSLGAGSREEIAEIFKQVMASGNAAWWQQDPDKALSLGHLGDEDFWRVAGLGGMWGGQGLESLGGDKIKDLAEAVGEAEEALGPFDWALRGALEGLDLSNMSAAELSATLQERLTPAMGIQAQLQAQLANGADVYTTHVQALNNTISSLLYTQDLSAVSQQQLIDLLLTESGTVEELAAKKSRLDEITKALANANQLGAEKTAALVEEGRALAKELGLQKESFGDTQKAVDKLVASVQSLVDALNGVQSKSVDITVNTKTNSSDSYHSGGLVRQRPRFHDGGLSAAEIEAILLQGEFVMSREAVGYYGEGMMDALNRRALPKWLAFTNREPLPLIARPFDDGGSADATLRQFLTPNGFSQGGPWGYLDRPRAEARQVPAINVSVSVSLTVQGDVVGEAGALERIAQAANESARQGAVDGLKQALREGSQVGEPLIHINGVYGQDKGY